MIAQLKTFLRSKKNSVVRGDTILEVVIATAILSTVMIATFSILQRAVDTNLNVKNRVIALNIAREGVEAVRNIRDTNWLKYSGDRRKKWLCLDLESDKNACEGNPTATKFINGNDASPSASTYYTVDFDDTDNRFYLNRETLQSEVDFLTGQAGRDSYRLYLTATAPQRYTHKSTGNTPTPFFRQLYLDIENPYDGVLTASADTFCGTSDADNSCRNSRLKIVSRVFWEEEGRTRRATLEAHLYDFFERDAY